MRATRHREEMLAVACGVVLAAIVLLNVGRDYPAVGHDFRYYIPRLLDTDLHIRINGMAVQWYTPTFGGGVPAFPNPQHLQHSVLQALTYFVNPWWAVSITSVVVCVAGFYAFYRFLRRRLNFDHLPSVLGGVFFIGNGFVIEHSIVGHVGFQLFPLTAVLLDAVTDQRRHALKNACIVALVLAAMVFQASVYLTILIALSLALTLPVLHLLNPRLITARRLILAGVGGLALAILMTGSKLYAGLALMRQFPREISDIQNAGVLQGLAGLGAQLFGAMPLVPLFLVAQVDVTRIDGLLSKLVGSGPKIGFWELDAGLSPVLTLVLCVAAVRMALHIGRNGTPSFDRPRLAALVILGITTWIVVETALAKGLVYPYLKSLPVLRSLHVNPRMASAFILPLCIVGAAAVNHWYAETRNRRYIGAALVVAMAFPLAYLLLPARMHDRSFDVTMSVQDYGRIRAGERFAVQRIAVVSDAQALSTGASSYTAYEPMFGYGLETFAPETRPGNVRDVHGGYFNMTHPASLVFPELNDLRPFERIRVTEEAALETFVNRRQPEWRLPRVLQVLNWVAVASCAVTVFAIGYLR